MHGGVGADLPARASVEILGPCRAVDESGNPVDLSIIQRRLLSRLAADAPSPTAKQDLIEAIWADEPPSTARASLQNQISRIRSRLGTESILTMDDGYALTFPTDLKAAQDLVDVAELSLLDGDPHSAFERASRSLELWRGRAFADLDDLAELESERHRIDELRRGAEQIRVAAALRSGRTAWAIVEAERLVAQTPLDESRWALLIEALDRAGRRGDALGAYERARRNLVEALGIEPGPLLRAAEAAVLSVDAADPARFQRRPVGLEPFVSAVDEAAQHRSVVVTGEPGMGKSTALGELARAFRVRKVRVASTRCGPHTAAATVLVELVEELGGSLVPASDPVHVFVRAIGSLASQQPVVLLIDDVDQAGPTTRRALTAAGEHPNVTLIGTARGPLVQGWAPGSVTTLTMPPLDSSAVGEMAASVLGQAVAGNEGMLRWLVEMTGGNPMLLEYLLAEVASRRESGSVTDPDQLVGVIDSTDLRGAVTGRLNTLDDTVRSALEIAAVCGFEFPLSLWSSFCGGEAIRSALATELVVPSDRAPDRDVRFRHGVIHRVLYAAVPQGVREEIHHAAADRLDELGAPAQQVAIHAIAAAALWADGAVDRALDAGDEATAQGAHAEAASWYDAARTLIGDLNRTADGVAPPDSGIADDEVRRRRELVEVRAMIRYGDALRQVGDPKQESALFEAAERAFAAGDDELVGDATFAVLQLGATTESGSAHGRAVELVERALEVLSDGEQFAKVSAAASLAYSMSGNPERCLEYFDRAEAAAVTSSTRRKVLPFAYLGLGHPRFLDRREGIATELVSLAEEADDPVALFEGLQLRYSVALQRGDGPAVRRWSTEMERIVDRVGDVGRRWSVGYQRAAIAHLDGHLDVAEQRAVEAFELFAEVSQSRALAAYSAQLLVIRMAQGRLGELAPIAEELVREQPGTPAWHAALALCLVGVDDERSARHARRALDDAPDDFTWLAAHVVGARAAAAVADHDTVAEYIERLTPWSGLVCWQGTCSYGPVDLPLAMLHRREGDLDSAEHHERLARTLAQRLQAPVFVEELERSIVPD